MLETVSLIWENPNSHVVAIKALIEHPQMLDKEIDDILKRTQTIWEGIFTKVYLICRVLFWKSYLVQYNEASEKLKRMMNKVEQVAERVIIEQPEEKPPKQKDPLELARLNYQYRMCNLSIAVRLENESLIDAFDQKSLLLMEIEEKIAAQTLVKGKMIQKVKSLKNKNKVQIQEQALLQLKEKAKILTEEVAQIKKAIHENQGKVFGFEYANAKIEVLEKMREELKGKLM